LPSIKKVTLLYVVVGAITVPVICIKVNGRILVGRVTAGPEHEPNGMAGGDVIGVAQGQL